MRKKSPEKSILPTHEVVLSVILYLVIFLEYKYMLTPKLRRFYTVEYFPLKLFITIQSKS